MNIDSAQSAQRKNAERLADAVAKCEDIPQLLRVIGTAAGLYSGGEVLRHMKDAFLYYVAPPPQLTGLPDCEGGIPATVAGLKEFWNRIGHSSDLPVILSIDVLSTSPEDARRVVVATLPHHVAESGGHLVVSCEGDWNDAV